MRLAPLIWAPILLILPSSNTGVISSVLREQQPFTSRVVSRGLELALSLPRRSYPHNALVRVRVSVRNISSHMIRVGASPAPECEWSGPGVEVLSTAGAPLYPPAAPWIMPSCGPPRLPRDLLPGRSLHHATLAVLRSNTIRAVVTLGSGKEIATPLLHLPVHDDPAPTLSIQKSPTLRLLVTPGTSAQHGPFYFVSGIRCSGPDQSGFGEATSHWELGSAQRDGAFHLIAACDQPMDWVFTGGWLDHPAVSLDYKTPTLRTAVAPDEALASGSINLGDPVAVAVKGHIIYVCDAETNSILMISTRGNAVSTRILGGFGHGHGQFDLPGSIASGLGVIDVADTRNHRVQVFSPSGALKRVLRRPALPPWWYTNPTFAPFLMRVAIDRRGNLYVFEGTMTLTKYSSTGRRLWQVPVGVPRSEQYEGYPVAYSPLALAVSPSGAIYASFEARGPDNKGGAPEYLFVQRLNSKGRPQHASFDLTQAFPNARPVVATGMAVAKGGAVWITDGSTHSIIEFSPDGAERLRVGEPGCGPGQFSEPSGIAINAASQIVVVDRGNHSLQILSAGGKPLYYWGTC